MVGRNAIYTPDATDNPDWRRHLIPYAPFTVSPDQAPYKCYHIQYEYVSLLLALLDYYCYVDSFSGTQEQREQSVIYVERLRDIFILGNMVCSGDLNMRIRQSTSDPCQLEVSYDNGQTWELGFDYGLCLREGLVTGGGPSLYATAVVDAQVGVWLDSYDDTVGSIAPNLVFDETSEDDARDLAMCVMVGNIVAITAAAALAHYEKYDGGFWDVVRWLEKARLFILNTAVWLYDEFLDLPVIPDVELYEWIRDLAAENLDKITQEDVTALRDADTLQAIQCFAVDKLSGSEIDIAGFSTMFNGVSALPGVSEDMETWLVTGVASEKNYVTALSVLDDLVPQIIAGTFEYECPCGEWDENVFLELVVEPDPWLYGANAGGNFDVDVWNHEDAKLNPASVYYYRALSLRVVFPECLLTKIEIADYTLVAHGDTTAYVWCDGYFVDNPFYWYHAETGAHLSWSTPDFNHATTRVNLLILCDHDINIANLLGQVSLWEFRLHGRGYNPFV